LIILKREAGIALKKKTEGMGILPIEGRGHKGELEK
jgi:hypothetical protein